MFISKAAHSGANGEDLEFPSMTYTNLSVDASSPSSPPTALGVLCLEVLSHLLDIVDQSRFALRIPQLRDHVEDRPGMHFHFSPEFVIGLGGCTRLEFIHERLTLDRHEMAVIPSGIPHREIPVGRARDPFRNLVISLHNQTISAELQCAEAGTQTLHTQTGHFDAPKDHLLIEYLDELGEIYHAPETRRHFGVKGLLLAYLSALAGTIEHSREEPPSEKLKISNARRLIRAHLGEPELSVKYLADLLHCSPDYLSHIFHRETGERLIAYIHRERIGAAIGMLRHSSLSISEVAYALGFESQAYFSRVFKQVAYQTPSAYRKLAEHAAVELDGRPKTIYGTSVKANR